MKTMIVRPSPSGCWDGEDMLFSGEWGDLLLADATSRIVIREVRLVASATGGFQPVLSLWGRAPYRGSLRKGEAASWKPWRMPARPDDGGSWLARDMADGMEFGVSLLEGSELLEVFLEVDYETLGPRPFSVEIRKGSP
jgi:hypothetical protein